MSGTPALSAGTVLAGRFEIHSTIGRGGFGITYRALDLLQQDECVVKELAPTGAQRQGELLELSSVPSTNPQRLKKRFLDEATLIGKVQIAGVLHLRDAFEELGTAYYVTDSIPGARTLERLLAQEGRMSSETVQDILFQLLDILEGIHRHRILHRDLKPSNILVSPVGEVFLIDFGSAREWHADSAALQTVLFTPGYAPLEQLSERGRKGPATDIYSLCATVYHMLAGYPPRPAAERADGNDITPLSRLRPDLDRPLIQAITAGLKLHFRDRPQSIAELRLMLTTPDPEEPSLSTLEALDATAVRLNRFSFDKQACPVCSGLLDRPKPLRPGRCPVCREGDIRFRELSERQCPQCRTGVLHHRGDKTPMLFCPICKSGVMDFHRKGLLLNKLSANCLKCGAVLEGDGNGATLISDGHEATERRSDEATEGRSLGAINAHRPWSEWLAISGRSREAWICDLCGEQYDVQQSGRWREIGVTDRRKSASAPREFFPDEWARIAAGLKPDAGNAVCDTCKADYWLRENTLTLLSCAEDPYNFGSRYLEKTLAVDDVPWLGAGKTSGNRGLLCPQCDTEFDDDGNFMMLVKSPSVRLAKAVGRSLVMEDWHRMTQAVPLIAEERDFFEKMDAGLVRSFETSEMPFDEHDPDVIWEGHASEVKRDGDEWIELSDGTMTITRQDMSFSRVFKKWRAPLSGVHNVSVYENVLGVSISGEAAPRYFRLRPVTLDIDLKSGERSIQVGAQSVAKVLERMIAYA